MEKKVVVFMLFLLTMDGLFKTWEDTVFAKLFPGLLSQIQRSS